MKKSRNIFGMIRNNDGVAAVEFALLAPMLLFILVGMIDYGLFINTKMQLQGLSDRAAQYVALGGAQADVDANIIQQSPLYTDAASNQTSINFTGEVVCECAGGAAVSCAGTCASGDYVRNFYIVTITAVYEPLLPWPGIDDSITLQGYSRLQFPP